MTTDHTRTHAINPLAKREVQWMLCVGSSVMLLSFAVSWHKQVESNREASLRVIRSDDCPCPCISIDINQAESYELALLPGVGPVLADRLVDDRDRNGDFVSVDQLLRVWGIGPKTLNEIRRFCVVNRVDEAGGRFDGIDARRNTNERFADRPLPSVR